MQDPVLKVSREPNPDREGTCLGNLAIGSVVRAWGSDYVVLLDDSALEGKVKVLNLSSFRTELLESKTRVHWRDLAESAELRVKYGE